MGIFGLTVLRQRALALGPVNGINVMTSPRRHYANRRNAMLSRGPRTNEGKAKSSQNALRHGLSARHALLAGEDANEYRRLRQGLIAEFSPQSALESELVERVASMLWRLRRIARFEAALMASIENDTPSVDISIGGGGSAKTRLGRYVQEFLEMDFSGKLMKYETNLQRQLFTVLDELRYLQERRRSTAEDQDAAPSNAETTSDQ